MTLQRFVCTSITPKLNFKLKNAVVHCSKDVENIMHTNFHGYLRTNIWKFNAWHQDRCSISISTAKIKKKK